MAKKKSDETPEPVQEPVVNSAAQATGEQPAEKPPEAPAAGDPPAAGPGPEAPPACDPPPPDAPAPGGLVPAPDGMVGEWRFSQEFATVVLQVVGPEDKVNNWAEGGPVKLLARRNHISLYELPGAMAMPGIDAATKLGLHAERTHVADCHMCGGTAYKYGNQSRGDLWFFKCLSCDFTFSKSAPK